MVARHGLRYGSPSPAGQGKTVEREYTKGELSALAEGAARFGVSVEEFVAHLGEKIYDVYLNNKTYWSNVPQRVWEFTMGGYQAMKKWLSYREGKLLGRAITADEAYYFRDMARRIAALRITQAQLDINYTAVEAATYVWPSSAPKVEQAAAPDAASAS